MPQVRVSMPTTSSCRKASAPILAPGLVAAGAGVFCGAALGVCGLAEPRRLLLAAMKKRWPSNKSWTLLEDNDPTGFKSKKGIIAKRQAKLKVFEIPKRSPDLNVCDYALWKQVARIMRRLEKRFPKGKRETRKQYLDRLRRAARNLPKSFIDHSIGDMRRRCQCLYAAKGGYFEEGGR